MPIPALLSASLPSAPGPYRVGYAPISHFPISPFSQPHPTHILNGKPALQIQQIGYSVFYPCSPESRGWLRGGGNGKGVSWVPEPFWGVVKGYEKFLGAKGMRWLSSTIGYIAGRIKMPVYPLAPLIPPPTHKYPLVIFSHGLAGTRHTYSQYCSALASEGYVVLAVEHRDGSGPAVCMPPQEGDKEDESRVMYYIKQTDLVWPSGEDKSLTHFRTLQLDLRTHEIYEAFYSFKRLLSEADENVKVEGLEGEKRKDWVGSLKGNVDWEELRLTGHSFGGGTLLHLLSTPSPDSRHLPPLPVKQAIALDPWLDPIPLPSDKLDPPSPLPPLLVLNSTGFTEWSVHFDRLMKMVKKAKGSLITVNGAGHQSFSDFPLLNPATQSSAQTLLNKFDSLSQAFFKRELHSSPDVEGKTPDDGKYERDSDGRSMKVKKEGKIGEAVIHVLGQE
ncbi:hypothetical protein CI109_103716 [Kwoniella shandongensis]|uniref:Putative phospholipase n=1 Tax=Kwoniella shandongensis TaxID=1734106 RepID=A0A5M6C7B7_9TREE|nr:uncharacterized protein CI109_000588 [Kwoniella shandongensis]KAA5531016.1 hypothetical protein CI109_000588 [Kwoniella shandongensis]